MPFRSGVSQDRPDRPEAVSKSRNWDGGQAALKSDQIQGSDATGTIQQIRIGPRRKDAMQDMGEETERWTVGPACHGKARDWIK